MIIYTACAGAQVVTQNALDDTPLDALDDTTSRLASQSVRTILGLALCGFGSFLAVKRKRYSVLAIACLLSIIVLLLCIHIYRT